jgi:ketosteroid isomerase-like protein
MNGTWKRSTAAMIAAVLTVIAAVGIVSGSAAAKVWQDDAEPAAMSRDETQAVLENYVEQLLSNGSYADFFADDIVVTLMDVGQETRGRDAAHELVQYLHEVVFDVTLETRTIVYGEGIASAEIVFVGTQLVEYAGVQPTGEEIRVPYSVAWELEDGKITDLRLYQLATGISTQLTALAEEPAS